MSKDLKDLKKFGEKVDSQADSLWNSREKVFEFHVEYITNSEYYTTSER